MITRRAFVSGTAIPAIAVATGTSAGSHSELQALAVEFGARFCGVVRTR